ncbi:MAG: hypothetical protein RIS86_2012, partial [Planctomycetota bacterium]
RMASKKKSGARRGKPASGKSASKSASKSTSASKSSSSSASKPASRRSAGRGVPSRRAPKPASASVALATLSTDALAAELKRRRSELPRLEKRAAALRAELAEIEARIAGLGGSDAGAVVAAAAAGSRARGRSRTSKPRTGGRSASGGRVTLGSRIQAYLGARGDIASPKDIAGAMAAELGRDMTPSFYVQTNLALRKLCESGAVVQVGRAQYRAGDAASAAEPATA